MELLADEEADEEWDLEGSGHIFGQSLDNLLDKDLIKGKKTGLITP
jgi:hypothetical protein